MTPSSVKTFTFLNKLHQAGFQRRLHPLTTSAASLSFRQYLPGAVCSVWGARVTRSGRVHCGADRSGIGVRTGSHGCSHCGSWASSRALVATAIARSIAGAVTAAIAGAVLAWRDRSGVCGHWRTRRSRSASWRLAGRGRSTTIACGWGDRCGRAIWTTRVVRAGQRAYRRSRNTGLERGAVGVASRERS